MTDAIILPDSGDGSRRARRHAPKREPKGKEKPDRKRKQKEPKRQRERKSRERRPRSREDRRRWPFLVVVLVLVAAGTTAWFVTRDDDDDGDAGKSPNTVVASTRTTGLLIQRTTSGQLAGATLFVDAGSGGDVMFLPPGTMVEAPSLGLVPLRETRDEGTHDLRVSTRENVHRTRDKAFADITTDQLAEAVRPATPLHVEVPSTVERRTGDRIETVFEPGPTELTAEHVDDYLDLPAETDLDRLVRHQSFWEAWLGAIHQNSRVAPAGTLPDSLREQLGRLAEGGVDYHVLPVKTVSGAAELYQVERTRLDGLIKRLLPGTPTWAQRITVQILNGTGKPGIAQELIGPLVDVGARVALTGNADRFGYTVTQVLYYEDAHANDARRVQAALGIGEVVKSRTAQRVVAVTVVVGADYSPAAAGGTNTTQGVQP
jgi:hypothetical protein